MRERARQWLADWQVFILALLLGFGIVWASAAGAQQRDSIGPAPTVALPSEWVDSLAAHYTGFAEQGYCLTAEQRADTFYITAIRSPHSVRARVINGKLGGIGFSCEKGQPTLHTHPDSLCAPNGTACEYVPVERRKYPSLADLAALKASGAPFDMIQYGPRDFWIYKLAPDAPPSRSASAGHYATPAADTVPRTPLDSLAKLSPVLDSLTFALGVVNARIDSIERHVGQIGRPVVVVPAGLYGVQSHASRRLAPLPFAVLLEIGAETAGRIDHDSGGYHRATFYPKKFVMHYLGGCAVEQLAESAHVPRWLAVTGTVLAAIRFEQVQGYPNRRDVVNGALGAASCATWSWWFR